MYVCMYEWIQLLYHEKDVRQDQFIYVCMYPTSLPWEGCEAIEPSTFILMHVCIYLNEPDETQSQFFILFQTKAKEPIIFILIYIYIYIPKHSTMSGMWHKVIFLAL